MAARDGRPTPAAGRIVAAQAGRFVTDKAVLGTQAKDNANARTIL